MQVKPNNLDFAKFPFLKESQEYIAGSTGVLESYLATNRGRLALSKAVARIKEAIEAKKQEPKGGTSRIPLKSHDLPTDELGIQIECSAYALARVIISCTGDRFLTDRLCRYEANRAMRFLEQEEDSVDSHERGRAMREHVARSVGIDPEATRIPVAQYVELAAMLRGDQWRLVNRMLDRGFVSIEPAEMDELLRERIRLVLARQLPIRVPNQLKPLFEPAAKEVAAAYQAQQLESFGAVEESAFPPCMQALIKAITSGTNLPHTGRFAMTAFLHTIGLGVTQIVELYCRAPDFDLDKTLYQVQHITGGGGTEYTPPTCATMRTYGLCIGKDTLCSRVNHPLSYYKAKKRDTDRMKKDATPPAPSP